MTDNADLYRHFVTERHRIWERRAAGLPGPWSTDPVLRSKKFTNVFRVLDAGTQFLVRELLGGDADTTLMRCWLYRYTNRPEPWQAFHRHFGRYPDYQDLKSGYLLRYWSEYQAAGNGIFGPAYQMFVGQENKGMKRLDWAVQMTTQALCSGTLVDRYVAAGSVAERVTMLQEIERCGPFMAMQITTDYGYSEHGQHDENAFIQPGPGAVTGAKAYDPGVEPASLIHNLTRYWATHDGPRLFGRPPSLMDVQNTFCEFSKYVRAYRLAEVNGPEKHTYRGHGKTPWPVLPNHWGLNT